MPNQLSPNHFERIGIQIYEDPCYLAEVGQELEARSGCDVVEAPQLTVHYQIYSVPDQLFLYHYERIGIQMNSDHEVHWAKVDYRMVARVTLRKVERSSWYEVGVT